MAQHYVLYKILIIKVKFEVSINDQHYNKNISTYLFTSFRF